VSSLQKELVALIEQKKLIPYYQPVVSLTQKHIIGYESFIRGPANSPFHNPLNLFDVAHKYGLLAQLEFTCTEISLKQFAEFKLESKLFLNISPQILLHSDLIGNETSDLLKKFGLTHESVVIELTEHRPSEDYDLMSQALTHYRSKGFAISLDDLGAGYSSLRLWSELLPEYVKIDKHFIQQLQEDITKHNFVRSIFGMANSLNCQVIAEGVETELELNAIEKIGIPLAQGYYFARPSTVANKKLDDHIFTNVDHQKNISKSSAVETICQMIPPISAETAINDVMNLFQKNSDFMMLPLVDNEIAVGIVFRDVFFSKLFSSRYGIELHGRKPIKTFIEQLPLSIDCKTPIEKVSQKLTSNMRHEQAFIITNQNQYMGMATILSLLEEITRQQIDNAKHANPLTLLPGSVPTNAYVDQLLDSHTPFAFGYFDLDNFKPFNDIYGYSAGDDIIKTVASSLKECVPSETGHIGHIGGDDFIVVFTGEDWLARCEQILELFKNKVPLYYTDEDVKNGGIWAENRQGEKCFFPMTSLSVGLVSPTSTIHCKSHVDIADLAAGAKKMAKKIDGNSYYINNRISAKTLEPIDNH
jgi:EAL domain-containing protein (putative c-di-GMP-specific phosphodiesterase class I)/GGDEF domain-containing protein